MPDISVDATKKIELWIMGMKNNLIKKLNGANMDIDLMTEKNNINWQQDKCLWNEAEKTNEHKCAVKNTSICKYFCGIEYPDNILCCHPHKNPYKK